MSVHSPNCGPARNASTKHYSSMTAEEDGDSVSTHTKLVLMCNYTAGVDADACVV